MKLTIIDLPRRIQISATMAQFGKPISPAMREFLLEDGLDDCIVVGCMGWIWFQWLAGAPANEIRDHVTAFVDRGMEMQQLSPQFNNRPRHDLFLLSCAIFASTESQLLKLAQQSVDTSGYNGHKPRNDGELFENAWCGMLKHWMLGDLKKSAQEAEKIWSAYRFPNIRAAAKSLVTPWLKQDWTAFAKQQQKDFEKRWATTHTDRCQVIQKETADEIVISVEGFDPTQSWCWAHCAMAMLAHRRGAPVVTDPLWFPPHALACVGQDR